MDQIRKKFSEQEMMNLVKVANFILWSPPQSVYGGISSEEAYLAFCSLVQVPEEKLRKAILEPEGERSSEPN